MGYINEAIVLDFYLQQMEEDNIMFLKGRESYKELIKQEIEMLKVAESVHSKIEVSKKLWKVLFESAMSYIDPDKRGYDQLFAFFDEYVNFEELIFASDSFYRDHTVHCLWVYFMGEYISKTAEFSFLFNGMYALENNCENISSSMKKLNMPDVFGPMCRSMDKIAELKRYSDSVRCIAALTHDLGYPLKKVYKINKCISRVLPYFSINNYDEFNFNFDGIQENYIDSFLSLLSIEFQINISDTEKFSREEQEITRVAISKIFTMSTDNSHAVHVDAEAVKALNEKELEIFKQAHTPRIYILKDVKKQLRYSSDFEEYAHGIMSAYLLSKTIKAFSSNKLSYIDNMNVSFNKIDITALFAKMNILNAISDHTSSSYQISELTSPSELLTLVDELEEFSRISRANQNRQYINEFCKTEVRGNGEVLQIDFIFDNDDLSELDPERSFRDKCKRFLSLFDISKLEDNIKLQIRYISKLSCNDNIYMLEIRRKYANITINGVEQNIPKYLKSRQFYTREEYQSI